MVSHSERKTRRMWKPNVQKKRLWSESLGDWVKFNVTTQAMRCVDKAGGLDNYLLGLKDGKIGSIQGLAAKRRIEAALAEKGR
mmetsp:Transcript_6104/g.14295  ORF Transcript_6104/g.14295 Transcript_6104/m.14295 type:complete len:83 (-) Transcript_6104:214-462(-)